MLATFRQRNFTLLWMAGLISILGDHLVGIALPFYVYAQTGSALATGIMVIAGHVPGILFGSVAGVFVDRWSKQWTMIVADLARYGACETAIAPAEWDVWLRFRKEPASSAPEQLILCNATPFYTSSAFFAALSPSSSASLW